MKQIKVQEAMRYYKPKLIMNTFTFQNKPALQLKTVTGRVKVEKPESTYKSK